MKKLIYLLALIIPLSAQEAKDDPFHASIGKETKEEVKEEVKECCQVPKESRKERGDMRRRMGMKQANKERKQMHKKQQLRHAVRLVVVGGLAYYIGYHQGEEHFNGGWDRRKDWGGRK